MANLKEKERNFFYLEKALKTDAKKIVLFTCPLIFSIPDRIYIIAVEIVECSTFGEYFTTEIGKRYNQIFRKICANLHKICKLDFVEMQKNNLNLIDCLTCADE